MATVIFPQGDDECDDSTSGDAFEVWRGVFAKFSAAGRGMTGIIKLPICGASNNADVW